MLIPSIDLMGGKLVQLEQGTKELFAIDNPMQFAKRFSKFTPIQVIDLDAAFGKGNNLGLIKEMCAIAKCRVGGGIRSVEYAKELIDAGAKKVIIGTNANKEFLLQLCSAIGKEKVLVALDSKKGKIAVKGWTEETTQNTIELAKELEDYCSGFLCTTVEKEGMLTGADIELGKRISKVTKNKISIAGGVSSIAEIKELEAMGVDSTVGMAIYSGKLNPEETFIEMIDFDKSGGIVPTIIQQKNGVVISLVYSNKESLGKTLESGNVWRYSREKSGVVMKGATSKNIQELVEVRKDCDSDALLFIVDQKGVGGCHKGNFSCFGGDSAFTLTALFEKIKSRKQNASEGSYTKKLFADERLLKQKLLEEAAELMLAETKEEVIWESADLMYFAFAFMASKGITIGDLEKENKSRDFENERKKQKSLAI
ncbi:MAG: phosphoribosyl-ATP diphosphatase [archaeon]